MERRTVKCCLLNMMWSLQLIAAMVQDQASHIPAWTGEGSPQPWPLAEELLAGNGCLGRESPFSSGGVAFARLPMPSG